LHVDEGGVERVGRRAGGAQQDEGGSRILRRFSHATQDWSKSVKHAPVGGVVVHNQECAGRRDRSPVSKAQTRFG